MSRWLAVWIGVVLGGAARAEAPVIGVASASGSFQVNHARVSGNATLFDGVTVETAEASSRLRLNDGTRVELAAESRAVISARRARLENGFGEVETPSGYEVEARGLRIATAAPRAIARIRLDNSRTVLVGAVNGPVRVFSEAGLLVANVAAGTALSFQPQAASPNAFQLSGCLLVKDKRFLLVDPVGNQTVEVRGAGLAEQVGNRVQITGTADRTAQPMAGASQVIQVQKIEMVGRGGCVAAAAGAGASTQPGAAKGKSHKGAIIAGVAVAGAGGGIAAAVCCKSSKTPTSP